MYKSQFTLQDWRFWFAIFNIMITTMCSSLEYLPAEMNIAPVVLSFPANNYYSIVWKDNTIVALARKDDQAFYAQEGDQQLRPIKFPQDSTCTIQTSYDVADSFPDHRMQVFKRCHVESQALVYLMSFDWDLEALEEVAGPLPLGSSSITWNPDATQGVVYLDSRGFGKRTLYWIWAGGFKPMDIVIIDGGSSWNLKDFYPDFNGPNANRAGDTGRADWSPDGKTIGFFASADAIGVEGPNRLSVEYKLYLMDTKELKPRAAVEQIHFPFIIKWSPDSKNIAFIGQFGNLKQDGIWLYSLDDNSVISVEKGIFQAILWAPDGKSLSAIRCDENFECSQVLEYDLSGIVGP